MRYCLGPDGKLKVCLYKSRLKNWGDFGPRSEVTHREFAGQEAYRGLYGQDELTISGLSGGALETRRDGHSVSWRSSG